MTFNLRKAILDKRETLKKIVDHGTPKEEAYLKAGIDKHFKIFNFLHRVGHTSVKNAVEIGVSYPWACQFRDEILRTNGEIVLLKNGWKTNDGTWSPIHFSLIDVRPEICQTLQHCFGSFENVNVYNFGISDETSVKTMVWKDGSTYQKGIESPAVQTLNDKENKEFQYQCFSFGEVDTGDIDVLHADIEGNEYFVLKTMKSRPLIITLELFTIDPEYSNHYMNPFVDEINQWMNDNDYSPFIFSLGDVTFLRNDFYNRLDKLGRI